MYFPNIIYRGVKQMSNCGCNTGFGCVALSVVASIVVAIITAFLTFSAAITITPAFLWVTLGIAVVYLAITYINSSSDRGDIPRECVCTSLSAIIIGILGTIITSLVLLGVSFAATSVIGALISGLLLGFLTLIFTSVSCYILCRTSCNTRCIR